MMMQQDSQETNTRAAMHHHAVDDDDNSTLADSNTHPAHDSPQTVIASIEALVSSIIEYLDREESPLLSSQHVTRRLTLSQSRSFTSICMVLSFSHSLLLSGRTTTTREVYYFFVTHFRSQRECDAAILDASNLLSVPRSSLGLYASPKGNLSKYTICSCFMSLYQYHLLMYLFFQSYRLVLWQSRNCSRWNSHGRNIPSFCTRTSHYTGVD